MKKILLSLWISACGAFAQADYSTLLLLSNSSSITYLIREGFEGTGYETTTPMTWVESGSIDEDNATMAEDGTQGLKVERVGATSSSTLYWPNIGGGTNLREVGFFAAFQTQRTNINSIIVEMRTNGTAKGFVQLRSTGQLRITDSAGSVTATTGEAVPVNAKIYLFAYWNHSTGVGNVEWSTTATKTGSGGKYAAFTGGATGMQMNQVSLLAEFTTQTNYFDKVRVHTNSLPSSPE